MNDMALMISWMSLWWHPNSWWHFDYHRVSPLNRGVMSWELRICNDSITAWYHKVPVCFGQTWQSPWWYQSIFGDIWWHSRDRPWYTKLNHDTTKSTKLLGVTRPWHAWVSWYVQIANQNHDWQELTMTFTRIHHDIKIYVMGLSDRVMNFPL